MKLRRNLFVLLFASAGLLSAPFQVSAQSTVVLDLESLSHADEFVSVPSPHGEGSLTVTSSVTVGSPSFTVFGPDDSRFAVPAALASDAVPVTTTITNDNNDTFNNGWSIDVAEFNPQGCRNCDPP